MHHQEFFLGGLGGLGVVNERNTPLLVLVFHSSNVLSRRLDIKYVLYHIITQLHTQTPYKLYMSTFSQMINMQCSCRVDL